jgi:hypothetical protein
MSNDNFFLLSRSVDFWQRKDNSISREAIAEFEKSYSIQLPESLIELYLISNGGSTEYTYFIKGDQNFSLFPEGILLPLEEWESLEDFIQDFDLDDDDLLDACQEFFHSRIIYRYGFEYFVLFMPAQGRLGGWIGQLDLASAPGKKPLIKVICKAEELVAGLSKRSN